MNQMNPMNPFGWFIDIKKIFLMYGVVFRVFKGSFRYIGLVYVVFGTININNLVNISILDVPNVHGCTCRDLLAFFFSFGYFYEIDWMNP